jgi:PAS domain S-box-containing protein
MLIESFLLSLVQNTAILLSLVLFYDYLWVKEEYIQRPYKKILAGLIIGGMGFVVMYAPWELVPGLVFDTRTILLSISGLFFGFIPTTIAMILLALYRIQMGGAGLWMGLFTIVSSGVVGLLWREYRHGWRKKKPVWELLSMGYVTHLLMLTGTLLLPHEYALQIAKIILVPVFLIYPVGTMFLGIFLLSRAEAWKNKKELFELHSMYSSLMENMPAGMFKKDANGRYTFVNHVFCSLKGLKEEEILGKNPQELAAYETKKAMEGQYDYNPRQRTIVSQGTEHHEWIMKNGKSIEVEEVYPQKDGRTDYFQVIKTPVFDVNGSVCGSQGIQFDITFHKQLEEALSQEQYLLKTFMDNTPDSIFFKDMEGRFLRVNKAQASVLGTFDSAEVIGKSDFDFFSEAHSRKAQEDEKGILQTGKSILNLEEKVSWEDGREVWMITSKFPFKDKDGKVVGTFGVSKDISPQKQLEKNLLTAISKVEESDRLKTSFLHNISHEIRTPMNAIVGFSGLLKDQDLDEKKRVHYANVVIQSSNQLLSIIDDIVRIATIEAGQERVREDFVQLNGSLRFVYEQFSSKAAELGLDFQLKTGLPDDQAHIMADETKLLQIFSNLLVNAFKFTKEGHIYFGYKLEGEYMKFFIEDTGIGIPQEMHEEIFKRFRQVDNLMSRHFGGSGLGLSICKAYIELMGGTIWLDSDLGKGSCFYFTLPYRKEILRKALLIEKKVQIEDSKGLTFLVAEDEDLNFVLMRELLRPFQAKIIRASNGLEAVHVITSGELVDLVLMDLKMPVMDGFEATRLIKDFRPDLIVIALTAYSQELDKKWAIENGCSEVLVKPIEKDLLYARLNHYLGL